MPENTLAIIISGFIGATVAYLGAVLKDIVETRTFVDKTLLNKRAELYQTAWEYTELLSIYRSKDNITREQYEQVSKNLHCWYFQTGGLYLSRSSQKAFAKLQKSLIEISTNKVLPDKEHLRRIGSLFRTNLTNDLISRRSARGL